MQKQRAKPRSSIPNTNIRSLKGLPGIPPGIQWKDYNKKLSTIESTDYSDRGERQKKVKDQLLSSNVNK